jgi:dihydropteroate synthase
VAEAALAEGADIINDITALRGDTNMAKIVAASGAGVVLMHMLGTPRTMQVNPRYENVVEEVAEFLQARLDFAISERISSDSIVIDPGIGFGKRVEDNLALLRDVRAFTSGRYPVLLGFSRKSFISKVLENENLESRLWPTVALCANAREAGVKIFRVHDVKACADAVRMTEAIMSAS